MVDTKKIKTGETLFFAFLVLFPLGQLLRTNINFFGTIVTLQPIDLVIGITSLTALVQRFKRPKIFSDFLPFLTVSAFSFLLSAAYFNSRHSFIGLLYLFRLFATSYFLVFVWNLVSDSESKNVVVDSLLTASFVSAFFGWVQYFLFPDLRPLYLVGWDDHLFRLAGTFLDPGFAGIIFVLGAVLSLYKFVSSKNKRWLALAAFFAVTTAFTYSRASYLALLFAFISFGSLTKKWKESTLLILSFGILLFFLPRPGSEGVQLERVKSIRARFTSYQDASKLISKFPLFGVGYNNLCLAKQTVLGKGSFASHSCGGIEASLLTILTTTGVVGFLTFLGFLFRASKNIGKDYFGNILITSGVSVFVHSLFVNSLFYPWVMAWMAILLALAVKENN